MNKDTKAGFVIEESENNSHNHLILGFYNDRTDLKQVEKRLELNFARQIEKFHSSFKEHLDTKIDNEFFMDKLSSKASWDSVEAFVYNFRLELRTKIEDMVQSNYKMYNTLSQKIDQNVITFDKFELLSNDFATKVQIDELKERLEIIENQYLNQDETSELTLEEEDIEIMSQDKGDLEAEKRPLDEDLMSINEM